MAFASLYQNLRTYFHTFDIYMCPLSLFNPSIGKYGFIAPGSGLRQYDEQGVAGFNILRHHWLRDVTENKFRRLVEAEPGSEHGTLWGVLWKLFFDIVKIFKQDIKMEHPKFTGDLQRLADDVCRFCLLRRKQGGKGFTQLRMVTMFLQALTKEDRYNVAADGILAHIQLKFPTYTYANLASDTCDPTADHGTLDSGVSEDENELPDVLQLDNIVT